MQVQKTQQQQQVQQGRVQEGPAAGKNEVVAGANTFSTSQAGRADLTAAVEQPKAPSAREVARTVVAQNATADIAATGTEQTPAGR